MLTIIPQQDIRSGERTSTRSLLVTGLLIYAGQLLISASLLHFRRQWTFRGDAAYADIIEHILATGHFPTSARPPLYSLVLTALQKLSGEQWETLALVVNVHLGFVVAMLLWLIVTEAFQNQRAGALAVVLLFFDFHLQFEIIRKHETILFTAILLCFFYVVIKLRDSALTKWVLLGTLAGLAHLTRPTGMLLILLALIILSRASWTWTRSQRLRNACALLSLLCVIIVPWQLYLHQQFGATTFTSNLRGGWSLYKGHNPHTPHLYPWVDLDLMEPHLSQLLDRHQVPKDERVRNAYLKQMAIDHIQAHPVQAFKMAIWKAAALWSPWRTPLGQGTLVVQPSSWTLDHYQLSITPGLFIKSAFMLMVYLGVLGFFVLHLYRREDRSLSGYAGVFLILLTTIHAITVGETRYRLPVDPLLVGFAAVFYTSIFQSRTAVTR